MRWPALILVLAACGWQPSAPAAELVGNPLGDWRATPEEAYARNIWDLQELDGLLYLGYGDAIVNTGPTQVIAYNPRSKNFVTETVINEEAITTLRVSDDRLFVPGVDAVDSPDGALYVRDSVGWKTLPLDQVVHDNDVIELDDRLCVAVQDRTTGGAVRCSYDDGRTWSTYPVESWRAVSLFQLGGEMFVSSHDSGIRRVTRQGTVAVPFVLEGIDDSSDVLVSRPINCGAELVFIAKRFAYRQHAVEVEVIGVFDAIRDGSGAIRAERVNIDATPTDAFTKDGHCYALTDRATSSGLHDVVLLRSDDGRSWTRALNTTLPALARSAELMGGFLYLGTGCDAGQCSAAAGQLSRIRAR